MTEGKTTTLIGKWENQIESLWNTDLHLQVPNGGSNVNGLNILGEIDNSDWSLVWPEQNLPWLEGAMSRGDVIRVASDPIYAGLCFVKSERFALHFVKSICNSKAHHPSTALASKFPLTSLHKNCGSSYPCLRT